MKFLLTKSLSLVVDRPSHIREARGAQRHRHSFARPRTCSGKESTCQGRRQKRHGFDPWVGMISWKRKWQPTPVFLPGESHGQRSLADYSPWSHKKRDMTECAHARAHAHTHTHTHTHRCIYVYIKEGLWWRYQNFDTNKQRVG